MTMDDIAAEAGISKRTIFRHFDGRYELIKCAFDSALEEYAERIPEIGESEPAQEWLARSLRVLHAMNLRVGRLWWDLATQIDPDRSDPVSRIYAPKRCMAIVESYAASAWTAYGGHGAPTAEVVDAFAAFTSVFYTHTMLHDYGRMPQTTAESNAGCLDQIIRSAVESPVA